MSSTVCESEDVHDFLERIKEIGKLRNREDEERNRKLEEDIIQSRMERQARRAERARSISPTKSSPVNIPFRNRYSVPRDLLFSDIPPLCATGGGELQQKMALDGETTSVRRNSSSPVGTENDTTAHDTGEILEQSSTSNLNSNIASSKSPTQFWHRRPSVQAPSLHTSAQTLKITTEDATHFQNIPLLSSPGHETSSLPSRDQVLQIPASTCSSNSKQENSLESRSSFLENLEFIRNKSPECELNCAAKFSDMTRTESPLKLERRNLFKDRLLSHSRNLSESELLKSYQASSSLSEKNGLRVSSIAPQKVQGRGETEIVSQKSIVSPGLGYRSLDRSNRSSSPTKGTGGFVQSAMMRRNDSVSKRWSASSSPNIVKYESVKNSIVTGAGYKSGLSSTGSYTNFDTRPHSSHSRFSITQESIGTSNSLRTNTPTPSTKSSLENSPILVPHSENASWISHESPNHSTPKNEETTPPNSPTKTLERRRWSPTKSSWLEAALNKPDFVKLKPKTTSPLQQPAWKSEIGKAKQKVQTEIGYSPNLAPKHEVNIGGLMRSRPTGSPPPATNLPLLNSRITSGVSKVSNKISAFDCQESSPIIKPLGNSTSPVSSTLRSAGNLEHSSKSDFRANLRSCNIQSSSVNSCGSELKNKFVQLRPTRTQKYVAPDEFKENITRGKASLNATAGPQKTNHKDEFKEAILKKKEDFRKAKLEGRGVSRSSNEIEKKSLPEALIKQRTLGRSNSIASVSLKYSDSLNSSEPKSNQCFSSSLHSHSASYSDEPQNRKHGKVINTINPNLAELLVQSLHQSDSQGLKPKIIQIPPNHEDLKSSESRELDTKLVFLTKNRARGPRRKPPSSVAIG